MATMIPPQLSSSTRSGGEKEVFRRLANDPGAEDWIVLHSLDLAEHNTQSRGEIDFVVIIPNQGVLCLEVKGCSAANLRRDDRGYWYYGPRDRGERRSPFQQAADAMHSLRRQVLTSLPELRGVHFASGVVFPFAPFRQRSVEWHEFEFIDSHEFRSSPISRLLTKMLESSRRHLMRSPKPPRLASDAPTPEQCDMIRDALRGEFEIPVDRNARSEALNRELIQFTNEQYDALDRMKRNSRTLFIGPAGSGKTFLAIEAARRAKLAGHRVLFVCFNRRLGDWLKDRTRDLEPEVTTATIHGHMLTVSGIPNVPMDAPSDFWQSELPDRACDRLLEACGENDARWEYDELIIDEAQDLLRANYVDFLDLSLRGGLSAGRWTMFGDFENQAIYASGSMDIDEFLTDRVPNTPIFSLRINCRNTPLVTEWVHLLAGLNPKYDRVLRPDDRVQPSLTFYENPSEQKQALVDTLTELDSLGFRGQDVVVLSTRADGECVSGRVDAPPWRDRLRPLSLVTGGHIGYCTIHSFKGLEADAIVVTDIKTITSPRDTALLYIATTRPLQRLYILAHSRVRDEAIRMLTSQTSALETT